MLALYVSRNMQHSKINTLRVLLLNYFFSLKAVVQLAEALRYKPEGRGFDSPIGVMEIFLLT